MDKTFNYKVPIQDQNSGFKIRFGKHKQTHFKPNKR